MNIIPVIRDLLLHNHRAVVPGLGVFILSQKPAQLSKVTKVLTPPSVSVRFESLEQSDDSQLANYLTRRLRLQKEIAIAAINDFVKSIGEKFLNNEPAVLAGFGILTKKANGEIVFSAEEELLKRISLFEMPKIEVPDKATVRNEPVSVPVQPPATSASRTPVVTIAEHHTGRRKWIIPIVLAGLLLGMMLVIYFTGNMGLLISDIRAVFISDTSDSTGQLVFGNSTDESSTVNDTLTDQISRELDNKVDRGKALSIEAPADNTELKTDLTARPEPETPVRPEHEISNNTYARPYHIVAGSFTVLANAEKQRASLQEKGLKAEILPKKGNYYMVSLGSFDTPVEASSKRDDLQKVTGFELWIMKNQ